MRTVCKNVSLTGLICRLCRNDIVCLACGCLSLPAAATQLFCQSLSSLALCSGHETFPTINNLCIFWRRRNTQVGNETSCSWEKNITQKWIGGSPTYLCKCTDTPSTLSINPSIKRNRNSSEATFLYRVFRWNSMFVDFVNIRKKRVTPTDTKRFLHRLCVPNKYE